MSAAGKAASPVPLRKQAALGVFWAAVERAITQGVPFLVVLFLARLLGPEDYGLVALAATIALFGQMLLGETFSQALIQRKDLEPAHSSSLFWVLAAAGIGVGSVQIIAAPILSEAFGQPGLVPVLRALSLLPVLSALQAVPASLFRKDLDFKAIARASATGTLSGAVVSLALAYTGFGVWSLVANLLTQNALSVAAIWRQSAFRPQAIISKTHLRELWTYAQFNFLQRIAAFTANQAPRILIGFLFGTAALGAFSLGLRIVETLYQLLSMPMVNVTMPVIARQREDRGALERTILPATQFSAMVSAPVFVALAVIAPVAVPVVFGAKWTENIAIFQWLCVFGVVGSCGLIWGSVIAGLGRPDLTLYTTIIAAIVNVTVLLAASPFGVTAAAAAFVVRGYVTLPFMPLVIARLTGIPAARQYKAYAPVAVAVAAMAVTIALVMAAVAPVASPLALTVLALAAGGMVYAAVLCVLARPALRIGLSLLGRMRADVEPA